MEKISDFPQINISKANDPLIQNCVLKISGLRDMGQLRDRYEGEAFYLNTLFKTYTYLASLEYLNIKKPKIDADFIEKLKPLVPFKDDIAVIMPFRFGSLPVLKIMEYKKPRIFVLQKTLHSYAICGVADLNVLNDVNNYVINQNSDLGEFKAFDKLLQIK